jgi:predicted nucleotidyltransferase
MDISLDKISGFFGKVCKKHPQIKLVYFFGSMAAGKGGPNSDFDFAVYMDGLLKKERHELRMTLFAELSALLGTDAVDLVLLNDVESPEMKYNVIKTGIMVYLEEPYKVLIEPKIMSEYFDLISWKTRSDP